MSRGEKKVERKDSILPNNVVRDRCDIRETFPLG